ncbi:uncharacterized protein LOC106715592 [Papilio machaon]|uniref:uncharacterized protein LOC106715592 n=1 Tax=Papilio machaon TaxID=76193 RepID=UPI001E665ADD|nr:uncharacterized protein LOC106715592 [Papilio machaon]
MSFGTRKQFMINPIREETSWKLCKLISNEDSLNLKITIQSGKGVDSTTKLSRKYIINNAVYFQMRMDTGLSSSQPSIFAPQSTNYLSYDTYSLFCSFENIEGSEKTYMAEVSIKSFIINTNKTFYIHNKIWRLLIEPTTSNFTTSFDIIVTLSLMDKIIRPFALLYKDSKSTDLRLIGKDGTIEVHSAILIAYSSVFNKKISEKAQESPRPYELALPHVKQSILQHLKDYIYLNKIPESPLSSLTDLIVFASEYNMKELGQMCTQKLATIAVAENFCDLTYFVLNNGMMETFFDILELIESSKIKTEDIKQCIHTENVNGR